MAISQDITLRYITEFSLKITSVNFLTNLPGANELTLDDVDRMHTHEVY